MDAATIKALGSDCVVRIRRTYGDKLTGIVAAVGQKWMLLQAVWDLELDGLSAIRLSDIKKVSAGQGPDDVIVRSLRDRKIFPAPIEGAELDTTAGLLIDVKRRRQLVTIHPERRWPGTCHLGYVTNVDATRKRFRLIEVTPAAMWEDEPAVWRFRDVRHIQLGDHYSTAIGSLAGLPTHLS